MGIRTRLKVNILSYVLPTTRPVVTKGLIR
jgi:hypothetical protein